MKNQTMMRLGSELAEDVGAKAIVSFLEPFEFETKVQVIWVEDLQLDVLRDLTMHDILAISERHLHDAAVQIYLSQTFEGGQVVGVFPYAVLVFDITGDRDFINVREFEDIVPRDVMTAALRIAMEIGREGREGRAIGTAFIIGTPEEILARSHQVILNPYLGQKEEDCDITSTDNTESIKEFAQLDGVFVISREGHIIAAGRYMDVAGVLALPGGFGGRHRAAAAITKETSSLGITVSESGGMVRVFREGACRLEIRSDLRIRNIG